jgi:TonB-linked SusC/RagA family outer membrane protein
MKDRNKLILILIALLASHLYTFGQGGDVIIKGIITSKATGETLVGVGVTEVNADNRVISGAVTDINGQYVIKVKNLSDKLVFSYMGFKKQLVSLNGNNVMNIVLEEEAQQLETVTVTAKVMQNDGALNIPKKEISTAMQRISTKDFEGVQVTSVDEALQGRIAGMDIVSNSGDPGSGTTMRIRGASSINGNTQPLIVINGVPYETQVSAGFDFANANQEQYANMLSINPDDIDAITVLKDAASTAIWGSKGANGVLLITTKKGVRGPTSLQYTYRFTRAVQPKGLHMLNGDDYTMMMKQARFNPQQSESATNVNEYNYSPSFSEYEEYNNNTDWVNEVTQTGFTNDHYLTLSGGGERATYRVSGGFFDQTGTIIGQKLGRISSRAYLDYSVSDRLKFISEFSFSYSNNDRNYVKDYWVDSNNSLSILDIAYQKMPNLSVYAQDANGNNTGVFYNIRQDAGIDDSQKYLKNPVALARLATNNLKNFRITPTFRIQYDILNPNEQMLRYSMYVSFDMDNNKTFMFLPREATNLDYNNYQVNHAENADVENLTVQTDNNITWMPKFSSENHKLLLYAAFQTQSGRSAPLGINTFGLPSSSISDASAEGILTGLGSKSGQWRSLAMMARAHYAFKERYILDATIRRDGSTKFGVDQRYGDFPGISAKWIISDETFMKNSQNWLSMLAIRPSWGISGNQPTAEYLSLSRYATYGNYMNIPAVVPSSAALKTLKWEKLTSYNLGMDIGFFKDKFVFDLNYYFQHTDDLLFERLGVPTTSGLGNLAWQNVGTMENKGWEVNFNGNQIIKTKDFSLGFNFNLANNKNTLVKLDPAVLSNYNGPYGYDNGDYLTRIQEGNSYGSIYGFRYKGVYQYNDYIPGKQENAPVARDVAGNVITDNNGVPLPMKFGYGSTLVNQGLGYTFKGGDAKYEDINHDGNIDELDIVYLGNSNPKLNGGFGPNIRYKGLTITAFFNFRLGNKIVNVARMNAENMYGDDNQSIAVNWRWRKDGDVTDMPRALYHYGYNWLASDRYVEDGSFLRFKYLTFTYALPSKVLSRVKIKSMNFYLTINNLMTFTKYTGTDPEVGYGNLKEGGVSWDKSKTPRSKDFTAGITIGL